MRRRIIGIAAALFLSAAVCLAVHFTVNPTIARGEDEAAAAKIAESWMRKQISLRDFEVTEAHFFTFEDPQTEYVAMTYSVKPYENALTCWYAGSGETGNDGWLVEKFGFIPYRRIGPVVLTGFTCSTGP